MTDLRQGVTETQHAVLDLIDERAAGWSLANTWEEKLEFASALAKSAGMGASLKTIRCEAIHAAALLIDAADEISRLINAAPTANELKHDKFFRLDGSPQTTGDPS